VALGIEDLAVGHWTDPVGLTGCTVVVPPPGNVAAASVRGGGPRTRAAVARWGAGGRPGRVRLVRAARAGLRTLRRADPDRARGRAVRPGRGRLGGPAGPGRGRGRLPDPARPPS